MLCRTTITKVGGCNVTMSLDTIINTKDVVLHLMLIVIVVAMRVVEAVMEEVVCVIVLAVTKGSRTLRKSYYQESGATFHEATRICPYLGDCPTTYDETGLLWTSPQKEVLQLLVSSRGHRWLGQATPTVLVGIWQQAFRLSDESTVTWTLCESVAEGGK